MLIIHPETTVTTVTKTLFRLACLPALLCSMQLQAQAITLEASTMTGALLIPVTTDAASLAQPAAGKLSVTQACAAVLGKNRLPARAWPEYQQASHKQLARHLAGGQLQSGA